MGLSQELFRGVSQEHAKAMKNLVAPRVAAHEFTVLWWRHLLSVMLQMQFFHRSDGGIGGLKASAPRSPILREPVENQQKNRQKQSCRDRREPAPRA